MNHDTTMDRMSWIITAVGALNWGLVGLANFDLVKTLFGRNTLATRMVYLLVGVAGVWSVYHLVDEIQSPEHRLEPVRSFTEVR